MRYNDVRIRVPEPRLGQFVNNLPSWAQVIGFDRLEHEEPTEVESRKVGRPKRRYNGGYVPPEGTTVEAVYNYLTNHHATSAEVQQALKSNHKIKAVNSAFYGLVHKGVTVKQKDGRYALKG